MSGVLNTLAGFFSSSQASASGHTRDDPEATIEEITAETEAVSITADPAANHDEAMEVDAPTVTQQANVAQQPVDVASPKAPTSSSSGFSVSTAQSRPRSSSVPQSKDRNQNFRFGYVFDVRMMAHFPVADDLEHPEAPERISQIHAKLTTAGCTLRMKRIKIRPVKMEEALLVHSEDHWEKVLQIARKFIFL